MDIPGLKLFESIMSVDEETALIASVDSEPWNKSLSRRTQHYGYIYDYASKSAATETTPIPPWCDFLVDRLLDMGILKVKPDQMIVNEYIPGQGIYPHVDDVRSFEDGIVSVSLASPVVMDFLQAKGPTKHELLLPRRSALALFGEARYDWRHGIATRKTDHGVKRGRRVSLTFRSMNRLSKKARML